MTSPTLGEGGHSAQPSRPARRGRRSAADADARRQILDAARSEFGEHGYAGVSMRAVARAAGVDASLVPYYFGSKQKLFLSAMSLPQTPVDVVASLDGVPTDQLGRAIVRAALTAWGAPEYAAAMRGVILQALEATEDFREVGQFVLDALIAPIAARLPGPDAEQRATLGVAQVSAIVMYRHVVEIPSLLGMETDALVAMVGDVVQHYLTGPPPSSPA